jgi:rubrerythrin
MLAVASGDAERAQGVLREFHNRGLSEAERAAADLVVDFDADETTCPACLTTFATANAADGKCPACGLRFG